jgi:hypothetical protein
MWPSSLGRLEQTRTNFRPYPVLVHHSSSNILLAIGPNIGTSNLPAVSSAIYTYHHPFTYRSSVSASRYALIVNQPIKPRSARKTTQLKNLDQLNSKCMTNMAVNSKLACQAWNLSISNYD